MSLLVEHYWFAMHAYTNNLYLPRLFSQCLVPNQTLLICAALTWSNVEECVKWMVPLAMSIREVGSLAMKTFKRTHTDNHRLQTSHTNVAYLDWMGSFRYSRS